MRFTHAIVCIHSSFLSLPNYISPREYTISYLFILLLKDIWVVSIFQLLWKMLWILLPVYSTVHMQVFLNYLILELFICKVCGFQLRFAKLFTIKIVNNSSHCTSSTIRGNIWIIMANLVSVYWCVMMIFIWSSLIRSLNTFSKVYLTSRFPLLKSFFLWLTFFFLLVLIC